MKALTVLYRGPLSSCNYGCGYCPFAKRHETHVQHENDERALSRFIAWSLERAQAPLRVFFTPWGEALTQRRYHHAMVTLSRAQHVERVAVQTNLSARLDWVRDADVSKLGFWATYHPEWTPLDRFVAQCATLERAGARYSVGVVGFPAHREPLRKLREALPPNVYVWVNAVKKLAERYTADDLAFFETIDPHFRVNLHPHASLGRSCRAGEDVISVDGEGNARRCHFIAVPIGNIYRPDFETALKPRPCSNQSCGCHIGYVHLDYLELGKLFGSGLLERIPERFNAASISHA